MNILFICSRNKKRSATAEAIFRNHAVHSVQSAGTEESAVRTVNEKLLAWADMIFVMEKRHKQKLAGKYNEVLTGKQIIIMDIPDEYEYMDVELVDMLHDIVTPYL